MLKNISKKRNKKKGFTLIELIVVLAVLAIIAMIAIPNFNQIRENSKIKSDENSAKLIEKAVDMLIADGTINKAIKYDYTITDAKKVPDAPNESQYKEAFEIYKAIKGTDAPQSLNDKSVKYNNWHIEVNADPNFSGGFKSSAKPTNK